MFATLESFSRSYPAVPDSVTRVRRDIEALALRHAASHEQLDGIRLAVSEAVGNCVVHAYRDGEGEVHITAAVTGGELSVFVADEGCGFNTDAESPGLGWGLALIAHSTEDFVLAERAEGGTEARMRFALRG
jgi:anti-sigma regulatory factor (Ser/Thr protein kinase)